MLSLTVAVLDAKGELGASKVWSGSSLRFLEEAESQAEAPRSQEPPAGDDLAKVRNKRTQAQPALGATPLARPLVFEAVD